MTCLAACAFHQGSQGRDIQFQNISHQIDCGDYQIGGTAARQAWSQQPKTEWGWRFKLQYISTLLYLQRVDQAADLLKTPLPSSFPALAPQYQYLQAYLAYYRHRSNAPSMLQSAIALARQRNDPRTEVNGLLLSIPEGADEKAQAEQIAAQALSVSRRNHLLFLEAASLSELGLVFLGQERYADAIPYFSQSAPLARKLGAHYLEVAATSNLGESYFQLGDLDRALSSLMVARALLKETDPSYMRISVNNELGSLESLRQHNAEAVQYFREAFRISSLDTRLTSYATAANKLTAGLIESGSLDEAEKYNRIAAQALKDNPSPGTSLNAQHELNRATIAAAHGRFEEAATGYHKVLQLLKAQPPNSLRWSAYAQLAVVNEHLGLMTEAGADFARALDAIEQNRSSQKVTAYQITFLSALIRFYQQYVDFLIRQHQPWAALAVADSSRASVLTHGLIASREQSDFAVRLHRQARATKTTLLFYWLAPRASYVWAIAPAGVTFQELSESKENIDRDVESYSHFIQNQREDTRATGNPVGLRLYRTLISPVSAAVLSGTRVVVVPDGSLHGVNFETLLVPGDRPHYWLEDATLTVAPNLGILLTRPAPDNPSTRALVIGDAVYNSKEYPALPQSAAEVTRVSQRFPGGSTLLTRHQAVRAAYTGSHPESFALIHFSAHMDADAQSPLDSAIVLSPSEGGSKLYARDVMAIPLHANLITFSGCRSVGAKALSGEGMVGFAWAAFQAGAQNAVTSLWAVDDRSTVDFMDNFYAGLQAAQPYCSALRSAKLQMLHSRYQRPYYWAPFQLYIRSLLGPDHLVAKQ